MNIAVKTVAIGLTASARIERARGVLLDIATAGAQLDLEPEERESLTFAAGVLATLSGPIASVTLVEGGDVDDTSSRARPSPSWVRYSLSKDSIRCDRCGAELHSLQRLAGDGKNDAKTFVELHRGCEP